MTSASAPEQVPVPALALARKSGIDTGNGLRIREISPARTGAGIGAAPASVDQIIETLVAAVSHRGSASGGLDS